MKSFIAQDCRGLLRISFERAYFKVRNGYELLDQAQRSFVSGLYRSTALFELVQQLADRQGLQFQS